MSDQKASQGAPAAPRTPRKYRVLHSAVDGFVRGDELVADQVPDIKRLLALGAVERIEAARPAEQE